MPIQRAKPRFTEVKNVSNITANQLDIGQIGGRKNIIINGAMQVAQRGTSFTSVAGSAYHLDRFRTGMGDTSARFTVTQATAGLNGFAKSFKYDCTTAEASLSNADARLFISQRIEGQNLQQLKKGTSDAEKITISFYVKSTKTGTYILEVVDHDSSRHISKSYTISSSGTWEQKILTFDADTTGALTNDNTTSIQLNWWLIAGTNHSSGTLQTTWSGYAGASDYQNSAVGNVNLGDNTSNTWEITGIQMEVGSQATPFEHRSFGEELALCSRYFYKHKLESDGGPRACQYHNSYKMTHDFFPVEMRAVPTATVTFNSGSHTANGLSPSYAKFYVLSSYDAGHNYFLTAAQYESEL
mgnify:CR=1 FL=1|tara:strand:+ start:45 stop:1112 length:1068 start_codon:yes stop_codon:yes gene_type:complete